MGTVSSVSTVSTVGPSAEEDPSIFMTLTDATVGTGAAVTTVVWTAVSALGIAERLSIGGVAVTVSTKVTVDVAPGAVLVVIEPGPTVVGAAPVPPLMGTMEYLALGSSAARGKCAPKSGRECERAKRVQKGKRVGRILEEGPMTRYVNHTLRVSGSGCWAKGSAVAAQCNYAIRGRAKIEEKIKAVDLIYFQWTCREMMCCAGSLRWRRKPFSYQGTDISMALIWVFFESRMAGRSGEDFLTRTTPAINSRHANSGG